MWRRRAAGLCGLLLAFVACASAPWQGGDALYRELGETAGIERIAQGLVEEAVRDPRIAHFFTDTDLPRLERLLAEQFCMLAGGPCRYSGDSMQAAHAGLGISQASFNALVEDLEIVMNEQDVPLHAQNAMLAKLAPMRREIVHAEAPATTEATELPASTSPEPSPEERL